MPIPDLYRVGHLQMINLAQYLSLAIKGTFTTQEPIIDQENRFASSLARKQMIIRFYMPNIMTKTIFSGVIIDCQMQHNFNIHWW